MPAVLRSLFIYALVTLLVAACTPTTAPNNEPAVIPVVQTTPDDQSAPPTDNQPTAEVTPEEATAAGDVVGAPISEEPKPAPISTTTPTPTPVTTTAGTPSPTPPPAAVLQPTRTAVSAEATFQQCVAMIVGDEIASAFTLENGEVSITESFNPESLPVDQLMAVVACAGAGDSNEPSPDSPPVTGGTELSQNFQDFQNCAVKIVGNEIARILQLTVGGLPDFSGLGSQALPRSATLELLTCVPALRAPGSASPPPVFSAAVKAQALAVAESVRSSVVVIESDSGTGSGFFISEDGLIMTNWHVIEGSTSLTIWLLDGRKFEASVVGKAILPDVGLLQLISPPSGIIALPIGVSTDLQLGQPLLNVGHPGTVGYWVTALGTSLQHETVSSVGSFVEVGKLTSSVPGLPGVSGSPLLNLEGRVVGLVYGGESRKDRAPDEAPSPSASEVREYVIPNSLGLAVPIEEAIALASTWTGRTFTILPSAAAPTDPVTLPASSGLTQADLDFQACAADLVKPELATLLQLTDGGLPDFSDLGPETLSWSVVIEVLDCVPGLEGEPSATLESIFSDEIKAQAQQTVDAVRSSVVFISSDIGNGSGFLISEDGLVMTNWHVVNGATDITVWLLDGHSYKAKILGSSQSPDVALLRIDAPIGAVALTIGSSLELLPNQTVVNVGHPDGVGQWVATVGSFLEHQEGTPLVSTIPGLPGVSGSPLLDLQGRVVGLVYGGTPREIQNLGEHPVPSSIDVHEYLVPNSLELAVPIEEAMALIATWM